MIGNAIEEAIEEYELRGAGVSGGMEREGEKSEVEESVHQGVSERAEEETSTLNLPPRVSVMLTNIRDPFELEE